MQFNVSYSSTCKVEKWYGLKLEKWEKKKRETRNFEKIQNSC